MFPNSYNSNNELHTLSGSDSDLVGSKRQLIDKNILPSTVPEKVNVNSPATKFDIAIAWLTDSYIPCNEASVPRQRMFQSYHNYCESNNVESLSSKSFGKLVSKQFLGLQIKRIGKRGASTYHYCGITFKTRAEKDRVEHDDESRSAHLAEIPVESVISEDPQQSNDIMDIDISTCQPPNPQEISTEYHLWLHASHCAIIVHCVGGWQFDIVEDELREFWLMERVHLNCNSFHNSQHFELFLLAEVQAYQDAVATLQKQLCDALSPDRMSMMVTFVDRLEYMHRNTNCYFDELRGCLGYFIHLMTRYIELAKITMLVDNTFSEISTVSAMYATWTTSLNFDSIVKRCIMLFNCNDTILFSALCSFAEVLKNLNTDPTRKLVTFADTLIDFIPLNINISLICFNVSSKILTDLMLKNDLNLTNFFLLKAWFDDYVGLTTMRNMLI